MKKIVLIIVLTIASFSSPAYDGKLEFEQKDGSVFKGYLNGDEWFSWIEDEEQNIVLYNKSSQNYEYAILKKVNKVIELIPSGIKLNYSNSFYQKSTVDIPRIDRSELSKIWKRKRKNKDLHQNDLKEKVLSTSSFEEDNKDLSVPPSEEVGEEDEEGKGIAVNP